MPLQEWAVTTRGGFLAVPGLSMRLLHTAQQKAVLRQFSTLEKAAGRKRGDTVYFDRAGNVSTAGSATGISETSTMPETDIALTQGSLVLSEFGNSIRCLAHQKVKTA